MKKLDFIVAVVGFYQIKNSFSGASEVSSSIFDSINAKQKKIFEIKNYNFKFKQDYINYLFFSFFLKPFRIIFLIIKLFFFLKKNKKRIVIIEGCSWIGFSFFLIVILKLFLNKIIIIYHAHNIEYEIREKKNSFLIKYLSKIFEKYVYTIADYATVVSKRDQIKIKKLYNLNSIILKNGISKKRNKIKKLNNFKYKDFIIFSGNFFYKPNEIAIKKLLKEVLPKLNKKFPYIKLLLTGTDFPKFINKNQNIIIKKKVNKNNLNFLISKSLCTILPLIKSPGTKLKVIESLMIGTPIIGSKAAFIGIDLNSIHPPFIYKNTSDINNYLDTIIKKRKYYKCKSVKEGNKYYKKEFLMENIIDKFFKEDAKEIT